MTESYYHGQGGEPREGLLQRLPEIDDRLLTHPRDYLAAPALAAAVDVALTLGMPLLLTGEPGSGKSVLADSLAWELGIAIEEGPLRFVVKSDTQARDLFYRFDTVGRFHAAQTPGSEIAAQQFIKFEALGLALLHAKAESYALDELKLPARALNHPGQPRRSVILIDEIDKAPRDVPNDILDEIARMTFSIPELSTALDIEPVVKLENEAEKRNRPIVIFTSNSEKALPEPFVRRCVYHHVQFPPFERTSEDDKTRQGMSEAELALDRRTHTVQEIVARRLGDRYKHLDPAVIDQALALFRFLREQARGMERRPTLAELLDWLNFLIRRLPATQHSLMDQPQQLRDSVAHLLLKKPGDQQRVKELLAEWGRLQAQQAQAAQAER